METILIFKVLTAPLLMAGLAFLARRFGPAVGGLAMGVPLVTGPISLFTAVERGAEFAGRAGVANLVGQVSTCLFCFAFVQSAQRFGAWVSAAIGIAAFFAATALWSLADWSLPEAAILLLASVGALALLMPKPPHRAGSIGPPRWDLPVRMAAASGFILTISGLTGKLGPQMSGLIAPFPVFVLIFAVFTHLHAGGVSAVVVMRGVVAGSMSFAAFFITVAFGLRYFPIAPTYAAATAASGVVSGGLYGLLRPRDPNRLRRG